MTAASSEKAFGVFYTGEPVASSIVQWAIRDRNDCVLDPSCGGGVFLSSAANRLNALGNTEPQTWGIDVDGEALRSVKARLARSNLLCADFFSIKPGELPFFDAVIGNPPFIRYQTFNGSHRSSALARAREAGVLLPQLSSSWAPFLVHATSFLRKGGRLGMVVPAELGHAQYAREVLTFLLRKFGRIQLRIFHSKLFPDLSEDTGLLLCEEFDHPCTWFSVGILKNIGEAEQGGFVEHPVDIKAIGSGRVRLNHYLLSPRVRDLYEQLSGQRDVMRLGSVADVGIGYVTGCNSYFHLSPAECRKWRIPARFLKPAVLSLADCRGVLLKKADWKWLAQEGKKAYLLAVPALREERLPRPLEAYLKYGRHVGAPERFKCRVRDPWYSVPHIRIADAFLSYMSGHTPRLVGNGASLVAPNTLHLVRFAKAWKAQTFICGWYSSLTKLSCELEGHPLGGGMLKLEPSEAASVLIPLPYPRESPGLVRKLDELIRQNNDEAATDLADHHILRRRLGLSATECVVLNEAAAQMLAWRMHR